MSRYRRYYGYRRYKKAEPGVEFIGSIILLFGTLIYYLIKGMATFIRWLWTLLSQSKTSLKSAELNTQKDTGIVQRGERIPLWAKSGDLNRDEAPVQGNEYFRKHSLLTSAEKQFYEVLEKIALENNYAIQSKVRLEALVGVHFYAENWWGLRNRIKSREMDFVLCEKQELNPFLIIELDDSSHGRWDRMERDENIDRILNQAGLPILHIRASSSYAIEQLTNQIKEKILTIK